jgi:hypothetical protein
MPEPVPATPATAPVSQPEEMPLVQQPLIEPQTPEEEEELVQREPELPAISPVSSEPPKPVGVVQRAVGEEIEFEEVDLVQLAQQIYPLIRRMLSIERERTLGRLT